MRLVVISAALAALLVPTTAGATVRALPAQLQTLTADASAKRSCDARIFGSSARGVATRRWTAPMSGYVNTRLSAARGTDWDLAVYDGLTGRLLASSQAFASQELAQTWVSDGQNLVVQACRQSGSDRQADTSVQLFDVPPPALGATPQLLEVSLRHQNDLHRLEQLGVDVTHEIHDGKADVIVNGLAQKNLLSDAGFDFETEISDLGSHFAASRQADLAFAQRVNGRSSLPSGRTGYRSLADYQAELKGLVEIHPGIVKPVTLPNKTLEGRPIEGVEIATDVREPEDGRPVWFVVATHHAREWPSGEAAMELAHMLVAGHGKDDRITKLLDRTRVVIVPLINVDGFVSSRGANDPADTTWYGDNDDLRFLGPQLYTAEAATGTGAYRRKTCRGALPVGAPCSLQYGVDPNRNYGEGWGGVGASSQPHDQTFRGPSPWSEPETDAVHRYSQKRQVTNIITIHNVAALVLRPPGRRADGLAPDEQRMKELGDAMADATGYRSQYGWQLYDTSGTTEDWNYAAQGAFGYTIEIGPGGTETDTPENYDPDSAFHMPYEKGIVREWNGWGPNEGQGLREALLLAGESAANPADHSVITGTAPAGTVLRAKKTFDTETSAVCATTVSFPVYFTGGPLYDVTTDKCVAPGERQKIKDELDTTMVVPASGRYEWHVNPSTRPFKRYRFVPGGESKSLGSQEFKPVAGEAPEPFAPNHDQTGEGIPPGSQSEPQPENYVTRDFTLAEKTDKVTVSLTYEPANLEDYDLYLFRKDANGAWQPAGEGASGAGSSGQSAGFAEAIDVVNAEPGEYQMRIVNYTARGDSWTAKVERFDTTEDHYAEIGKEFWTLTCESADGSTVYETKEVFVDRGEQVTANFDCGGPAQQGPSSGGGDDTGDGGGTTDPGTKPGEGPKSNPRGGGQGGKKGKKKSAKAKRAKCIKKANKIKKAKKRKAAVKKCKKKRKAPANRTNPRAGV